MDRRSYLRLIAAGLLLLPLLLWLYLAFGTVYLNPLDLLARELPANQVLLLLDIRLPRALLALCCGAVFSAGGAVFQAILQNPLADPFILGVSGGAALGAAAVIAFSGLPLLVSSIGSGVPVFAAAFAGAALSSALVLFAGGRGRRNENRLLLAGVVFNFFASSVIVVLNTVLRPEKAQELIFWLSGSLADPPPLPVLCGLYLLCAGCLAAALLQARGLNALSLGQRFAHDAGFNPTRLQLGLFLPVSLMTAAMVCVTGLIGFVGILVPQGLRLMGCNTHGRLLPASMLWGAVFLLLADLLARLSFPFLGTQAPVGAVTALFGAPAFFLLLRRNNKEEGHV